MKFKKIDKEFLVTDSSVNVYGFRLLTSGYQVAEFQKNPIGYYMHIREDGIVVRWEDFRFDGDRVFAKPVINLSNARGTQTVDEIENGFLNAASVGHIVALEYSEEPSLMVPGQSGPTITKWYNRELSLVDIPGNMNALTQLYDADDNPINLSDFNKPKMKTVVLSAAMLAALKLPTDADQTAVDAKLSDLATKAGNVDTLQAEVTRLKSEKDIKAVKDLLDNALTAGKITKEVSVKLSEQFSDEPDRLKDLLDAMPAYRSITSSIEGQGGIAKELAAKSWDDLHKEGRLEHVKTHHPALYAEKFQEAFGYPPATPTK